MGQFQWSEVHKPHRRLARAAMEAWLVLLKKRCSMARQVCKLNKLRSRKFQFTFDDDLLFSGVVVDDDDDDGAAADDGAADDDDILPIMFSTGANFERASRATNTGTVSKMYQA